MTIKEIKKLMVQYKEEAASKIQRLDEIANDAGPCWDSQQLGMAKGYVQALEEMLAHAKSTRKKQTK